jgi:uncharacterized protein YndB with AHSA1/START domain
MSTPEVQTASDVVVTQHVAAPRETVFEFLVDPEKMNRWMGRTVQLDPQPGGKVWIDMTGSDIAIGSFVEVDRPNRVVFTWGWEGSAEIGPGSTTVTISLTEGDNNETIIELRHAGLPSEASANHADGWGYFAPRLAAVAEDRDPGPYRHAPES